MRALILFVTLLTIPLFAKLDIGDVLGDIKLNDQFGQSYSISKNTDLLILTFQKDSFNLMNGFLENKRKYYLKRYNTFFIADISKIPTFIKEFFVLPKIQKYQYPIMLINDSTLDNLFDYEKHIDDVMFVSLENFKITNIEFFSTQKGIENFMFAKFRR